MVSILWVGLGGALGASSRFLVSEWSVAVLGRAFPYGTLIVNVLGSLAMGVFLAAMSQEVIAPVPWRQLVAIGFLGAFTTFSTFSVDTLMLFQHGETVKALLNVGLNLALCLSAAAMGAWLLARITG
ncbi:MULTISPECIES: fluoride efflux transporter CrcB [Salinivibrio]|uniref:Fluoride-specific ion channel FluC n=1 Tax=Salinivibrio siamensis TaxID=414286 RepID=A0ABX3K5G1_9GAMM|nr:MULTISPECIES: fluoride efflux transporter CrcB [Salinivibrio]KKA44883.1 camphor resistance protein CrcB [Salinivibrio sp. KP-1]OOE74382.1 camphor resistance protein CrcB [Salinivibrio sp. ML290]OOE80328.1 camphor resistance protein CrcB [Salinivibrio siamensis]OOE83218.1 camphor resistance protein CrcB [Salinivibrio sp. PR6]